MHVKCIAYKTIFTFLQSISPLNEWHRHGTISFDKIWQKKVKFWKKKKKMKIFFMIMNEVIVFFIIITLSDEFNSRDYLWQTFIFLFIYKVM